MYSWKMMPLTSVITWLFLLGSVIKLTCVDINNFLSKLQIRVSILSRPSKLQRKTSTDTMDLLMVISPITATWASYHHVTTEI